MEAYNFVKYKEGYYNGSAFRIIKQNKNNCNIAGASGGLIITCVSYKDLVPATMEEILKTIFKGKKIEDIGENPNMDYLIDNKYIFYSSGGPFDLGCNGTKENPVWLSYNTGNEGRYKLTKKEFEDFGGFVQKILRSGLYFDVDSDLHCEATPTPKAKIQL